MKKILGLAAGILLSVASIAQGVTFTDAQDGYNKTTAQTFHFKFEGSYSVEQIDKAAAFYTSYFTVQAVQGTGSITVTVTLAEDTEMNRRVISRFFISLEVQDMHVNGASLPLQDFMSTYIML